MHLNDHCLRQLDEAYIQSLDPEALRGLSLRLLADLKEARDRLNQGPENSSRPPSSAARLLPHRVNRAARRQVVARCIGYRLRRLPVSLKVPVHYDSAPY